MRKVAIGLIGAVLLLSGFAWKAEAARCPYPMCLVRLPSGALVCMRLTGVPPGRCPPPRAMMRGAGCCKQYGTWHCPCPPKQ